MQRPLFIGIICAFIAVALGAFGAHALKTRLDEYSLGVFKTATEYMFFHSFALIGVSLWARTESAEALPRAASLAAVFFSAGVALFCGSLYAIALTGIRKFGMITPLGGLAFLLGWASWGWAVLQLMRQR